MTDPIVCKVDGCGNASMHLGWCRPHYRRWNKHGDPTAGGPFHYSNPDDAFKARTILNDETGCVEWSGSSDAAGYGSMRINRKPVKAHRYSWCRKYGSIPDGMMVLHKCDNPKCVNVDHLFLGDHNANMADMDAKGRRVKNQPKGTRCHASKITEADVPGIRSDPRRQVDIAAAYGITQSVVSKIKLKQAWSHVK